MKTFYFTATGNSLEVAKAVGGELHSIPQVLKSGQTSFEDDAIGLVFPCYAFGTPAPVREFLQKVKLKSGYLFAVITYGDFEAGALAHFRGLAKSCGLSPDYLNSISMVDNYLNFCKMEDQQQLLPGKKVAENLSGIVADIGQRKAFIKKPWFLFTLMSYLLNFFYRLQPGSVDKKFSIEESCDGCGICASLCPVDNIVIQQGKPEFLHKCITCYACTHGCPKNAIRCRSERSRARFRNSAVSLQEIIAANK